MNEIGPGSLPGVSPWQAEPYRLWSLYDMLIFSAHAFLWCGSALRTIAGDCLAGSLPVSGDTPVYHLGKDIDGMAREKALRLLPDVAKTFREIGLLITADTVDDVIKELASGDRRSFDWLASQTQNLERLAEKELKNKLFLYVPPERAKYWPKTSEPFPFGADVLAKFPSTTFDVVEAAQCVATSMSTAAVFHLMRTLEAALGVLGKQFGLDFEHTNWAPAIEEVEKRIRNMHREEPWKSMPDCKELQEFYAQAASHLGIMKDAWRNYTAHARGGKFTEEEAERIFEGVKGFMQKLAARLSE